MYSGPEGGILGTSGCGICWVHFRERYLCRWVVVDTEKSIAVRSNRVTFIMIILNETNHLNGL